MFVGRIVTRSELVDRPSQGLNVKTLLVLEFRQVYSHFFNPPILCCVCGCAVAGGEASLGAGWGGFGYNLFSPENHLQRHFFLVLIPPSSMAGYFPIVSDLALT